MESWVYIFCLLRRLKEIEAHRLMLGIPFHQCGTFEEDKSILRLLAMLDWHQQTFSVDGSEQHKVQPWGN